METVVVESIAVCSPHAIYMELVLT